MGPVAGAVGAELAPPVAGSALSRSWAWMGPPSRRDWRSAVWAGVAPLPRPLLPMARLRLPCPSAQWPDWPQSAILGK
eukprot:9105087-Pyramimonas_sp.AAC.1